MPIHVLHAVGTCDDRAGAGNVAMRALVDRLRSAGIASDVVAAADGATPKRTGDTQVTWHCPRDVARLMPDADVVHVHGVQSDTAAAAIAAARRAGKPYVVSPHGAAAADPYDTAGWFKAGAQSRRIARALRGAAAVGALNDTEAAALRSIRGVRHVCVLPYGLEAQPSNGREAAPQERHNGDDRYVLFLGPIHPAEGLVPLLRAVAELGHDFRGWKLLIAGPEPGVWRAKLEAAVVRKRASDRVTFLPNPNVTTQQTLLARASVLVAPTIRVRSPVSVARAIAAGVPVVASEQGLPPGAENVVHVCRPDRAELRDALRPLITCDDDERRAIGRRAMEAGARVFNWTAWISRYIDVYRNLAGS